MEFTFNPHNQIIKLCLEAGQLEAVGDTNQAKGNYIKALTEASNLYEVFIANYYYCKSGISSLEGKIEGYELLENISKETDNYIIRGAMENVYLNLANCYKQLGDSKRQQDYLELSKQAKFDILDAGPFYHGTRAELSIGDILESGHVSNYDSEVIMNHVYFTVDPNGAGFAASLAAGEKPERVFIVKPLGDYENDPNVTDVRFPGNPTRSYRTDKLEIIGEITDWNRLSPEVIADWKNKMQAKKGKIIN